MRAAGPAVVSGLVVGAQRRVAERVDVRDRAIDHCEETAPAEFHRIDLGGRKRDLTATIFRSNRGSAEYLTIN